MIAKIQGISLSMFSWVRFWLKIPGLARRRGGSKKLQSPASIHAQICNCTCTINLVHVKATPFSLSKSGTQNSP